MPSRRQYLAGLAGVGSAALAGCSTDGTARQPGEPYGREVPHPSATPPDHWVETGRSERTTVYQTGQVAFVDWTAAGNRIVWENRRLRDRVREDTLGQVDRALMVAFAVRLELFSVAPTDQFMDGIIEEIKPRARANLETQMEEFGLTDIEYQGEDEDAPVEHAPLMRYTATYPIEDIAVEDVSIPNVDRTEFVVDGQDLDIEGVVDVWNEDGSVFAAGGVYPVESYQHTERFEITDAVDFSIDIDLQFDHARQETEVKAFIGTVGP